jgi:membrane-bound ClpP family serine protease
MTPRRSTRYRLRGAAAIALALGVGATIPAAEEGPAAGAPAQAPPPVPSFRRANEVAVLTIEGEIDAISLLSLERRIRAAIDDGAEAIVLEIDTPGGRLDATLDICNLIKDTAVTPANTVAWIHPQAYSAGTIIALACRELVVSPNATFGDAAPIQGMPIIGLVEMAPAERAKAEAPILGEVIDSARRNHYDENLVQAFVKVGIELWLVENATTGERIFVNRAECEMLTGAPPPDQIPTAAAAPGASDRVAPRWNSVIPRPDPAQAPGLTEAEYQRQIQFQQSLPPLRAPLSETDRGQWRLVTQVDSADRLLTVKSPEALYYGLAAATIADDRQLAAFFGASTVRRYDRSWSEGLTRFLVSWPVRTLLIVVFLLSLFIELSAPGVGAFGASALVSLLLLVGAPALAGMAQWWEMLLIAAGVLLVGLEVFVVPGTGLPGVAGALCLITGLVGTFVTGDFTSPAGRGELGTGLIAVLTGIFAAVVGVWILSKHMRSFPFFDRLVLKAELRGTAFSPSPGGPPRAGAPAGPAVGDVGTATTDLRPAGRAIIGDRAIDVQSRGSYIVQGSRIRVTSVGRYVVEVEEAET